MIAGRILIVCALPEELPHFSAPPDVQLLAAGVGPVEAAAGTARALAGAGTGAVISAGIGGIFRGRGAVGDAFAIGAEHFADLGLESGEPLALPGGATLVDRVEADAALLAHAAKLGLREGVGLTVTRVTTTDATADRLCARYQADVESMEGFAVLRAAALAGIPALEIRGISNIVGDRARGAWDFRAGAQATVSALHAVLVRLRSQEGAM